MVKLLHIRSGRVLADRVEVARTMPARMRGLLGRSALPPGGGLLIERCASIHTFFMRFSIDAVFLDADLVVRKVAPNLKPWRLASCWGARCVLELSAGALGGVGLAPGDLLRLEESS